MLLFDTSLRVIIVVTCRLGSRALGHGLGLPPCRLIFTALLLQQQHQRKSIKGGYEFSSMVATAAAGAGNIEFECCKIPARDECSGKVHLPPKQRNCSFCGCHGPHYSGNEPTHISVAVVAAALQNVLRSQIKKVPGSSASSYE
jgi:hypothetical protein